MDIKDVKDKRAQCESEIRAIIAMFEHQTETRVTSLDIIRSYNMGSEYGTIIKVEFQVKV